MKQCLTRMCFALWLGGAVLLSTSGCARFSYMGISMIPGETAHELQVLARRAKMGDKGAQLDLGIRFEEGRGVLQDSGRAIKLYRKAASDSSEIRWVYLPPIGNGTKGRVFPVSGLWKQVGLNEAKQRMRNIRD